VTPHIFGIPTRTLRASFCIVIVTTRNVPGHIHTLMTFPYSINRGAVLPPLLPIQLLRVAHPLWRKITQNFLCGQNDPPIPCHSWIPLQASYPATSHGLAFLASRIIFLLTYWYPSVTLCPHSFSKVSTRSVLGSCFPVPSILRILHAPQYSPLLDRLSRHIPQG
jgi:hypothetical protein